MTWEKQNLITRFLTWNPQTVAALAADLYLQNKELHQRLRQLSADASTDTSSPGKQTSDAHTAGALK